VRLLTKAHLRDGRFDVDPASRYLEFYGGLGDIFNHIHWLPCYGALDDVGDEPVTIVVSSHNPYAHELFHHHPRSDQFTIINLGFCADLNTDPKRAALGFRMGGCEHKWPLRGVKFFAAPADEWIAAGAKKRSPYIVFAAAASDMPRTVPDPVVQDACRRAAKRGFMVAVVGRNYKHDYYDWTMNIERKEFVLTGPNVVDLVDRLTVPGVARLVEGASGVFTAHSSVCHLAWHIGRPVFLLYDEFAKNKYLPKGPGDKYEGYMFGAGRPGNDHMWFPEYTSDRFEKFLDGLAGRPK
jgi:hypothetical protein